MFEALRWRLTAWYVLAFAAVFVVVGVLVFVWVDHRLSNDVEAAIREVSDASRAVVDERGTVEGSEPEVRSLLEDENLGGAADVFVLLLRPDGSISSNPGDVPIGGLPSQDAVERARQKGEDWRSGYFDGQDLKIRTVALYGSDGSLLGFMQAGKSLEERDDSLQTLAIVMAGGALAGLVLATVGGLVVAGIAMRPVRRSFERQREFVADASHELRTPLAVIRTNAEALAVTEPADEAVDDIVAEARYMTRLLDDLLLLAGSDRQGVDVQRESMDLAESARDAGHIGSQLAAEAGLRFSTELNGPLPVEADSERCREVLLILLDNAVKYTPRGGSVVLRAGRNDDDAVISVTDTGIGVGPEHMGRIFDRFYRVDKARSRAAGGTGLGLSIAREIVDALGGSLQIASGLGKGTTVTLKLRLQGR